MLDKLKPVSTMQALETKFENPLIVWDDEKHFWHMPQVWLPSVDQWDATNLLQVV